MSEKYKPLLLAAIPLAAIILSVVMLAGRAQADDNDTPAEQQEESREYLVRVIPPGGSIYQAMQDMGATFDDIARYSYFMGQHVDVSKIQIGDTLKIAFALPDSADSTSSVPRVQEVVYRPDLITFHIFTDTGDSLAYHREKLPFETRLRLLDGYVEQGWSLDYALEQKGLPARVRQQIIKPLESKIAFRSYAQPGDYYRVMLEEYFFEGLQLPGTAVYYVSYEGRRISRKEAFRYREDADDSAFNGMYNPEGEALMSNAVRSPLDYMHVTSPFGARIHPISRTRRMHNGVDYRGRTGTPVYAVASGRVISAGVNGGYGREVQIAHQEYTTQYAHLSKIHVRRGQAVHKGQLIGRVGNTGYSTGPHLHFGVRRGRRWVNPISNLNMVGAVKLKDDRLGAFKTQMEQIRLELEKLERQWLTPTTETADAD
ncbi:MAG: M23 family metallopeptidase [Candidatus Cloacimonetes bacterium]|nr:M23 family metallopeptidase [Candidatus Cloacimonadota bacterium]